MDTLELRSFTEITKRVVESDGLDEFMPTLLVDRKVRAIKGIPPEIDHREAIQRHAAKAGLLERSFFFAVRTGSDEITTGHFSPGSVECMAVIRSSNGFTIVESANCSWWRLGL